MNFIAILVTLGLDRGLRHLEPLRDHRLGSWYFGLLKQIPAGSADLAWVLTVLAVILPALGVDGIQLGLASLSPVLAFIAAVVFLLMSLGPRDAFHLIRQYRRAVEEKNHLAATRLARLLLEDAPPAGQQPCTEAVAEALLVRVNDRLFGPLFWFLVLGPSGAVLYWLSKNAVSTLRPKASHETPCPHAEIARRIHGVLAWIPAHLLALSYGLVGSFDSVWRVLREYYRECELRFFENNDAVLACAGRGAIEAAGLDPDNCMGRLDRASVLATRALVLWLVVIGLFTLGGWIL
jgi:membrane protein required for beta-lactamase induction